MNTTLLCLIQAIYTLYTAGVSSGTGGVRLPAIFGVVITILLLVVLCPTTVVVVVFVLRRRTSKPLTHSF